jgi:hypothetical protein
MLFTTASRNICPTFGGEGVRALDILLLERTFLGRLRRLDAGLTHFQLAHDLLFEASCQSTEFNTRPFHPSEPLYDWPI